MNESLHQAILRIGRFSSHELKHLANNFSPISLKKNDFLLKEGEICSAIYFLEKGALRQYSFNRDMEENTHGLYLAYDWVTNRKSFTSQKPSENFIEAFEDSRVYKLNIIDIHRLIGDAPVYFQLGKILETSELEAPTPANQLTPEEKYNHLLTNRAGLLQTFPLKIIASFINITPETLSRVRKKISQP